MQTLLSFFTDHRNAAVVKLAKKCGPLLSLMSSFMVATDNGKKWLKFYIFIFSSFIFLFCIKKKIDAEGGKGKTYNGAVDAAKKIYARSGLKRGLYAGLSAAYLRQWT